VNAKRVGLGLVAGIAFVLFVARAIGCALEESSYVFVMKNGYPITIRADIPNRSYTLKPGGEASWGTSSSGTFEVSAYDLKGKHLKDFYFSEEDLDALRHGHQFTVELRP
jgi:hypothetical protein